MGVSPQHPHLIRYIAHSVSIALAFVLIWRGIWYFLDELDHLLFGGTHWISAFIGLIVGFLILYLPDRDLKEIEKL